MNNPTDTGREGSDYDAMIAAWRTYRKDHAGVRDGIRPPRRVDGRSFEAGWKARDALTAAEESGWRPPEEPRLIHSSEATHERLGREEGIDGIILSPEQSEQLADHLSRSERSSAEQEGHDG